MTDTVLLAGATGMLGGRIAAHLLDHRAARVRLLVRPSGADEPARRQALAPLLAAGAEVVEGDLADEASLDRAVTGVNVIVSAVQGGSDTIVAGQLALARAGVRHGVRRMLPSDFALDLFKATPGEHAAFDARREAAREIAATGLDTVHLLQGAFMEMLLPGRGALDLEQGTVSFFGDGERLIEVTSVEDTARMAARVALDRDVPPGKFAFAGDRVSFRQAAAIVSAHTGRPLHPVSRGTEADLRVALAAAPPPRRVMLAYLLYMTTGQTALSHLQNDRYPDLALEGFAAFVGHALPAADASGPTPPPTAGATP